VDLQNLWGAHYSWTEDQVRQHWEDMAAAAVDLRHGDPGRSTRSPWWRAPGGSHALA